MSNEAENPFAAKSKINRSPLQLRKRVIDRADNITDKNKQKTNKKMANVRDTQNAEISNDDNESTEMANLRKQLIELTDLVQALKADKANNTNIINLENIDNTEQSNNGILNTRKSLTETLIINNDSTPNNVIDPNNIMNPNTINTNNVTSNILTHLNNVNSFDVNFQQFWKHDPVAWFEILETHFNLKQITIDTLKYANIMKNLGDDIIKENNDIFKALPAGNKYNFIKESLLSKYNETTEQKLHKLMNTTSLGDRKPSTFFHELINIANNLMPRTTILTIWKEKLPNDLLLFLSDDLLSGDISRILEKADRLHGIMNRTKTTIAKIATSSPPAQSTNRNKENYSPEIEEYSQARSGQRRSSFKNNRTKLNYNRDRRNRSNSRGNQGNRSRSRDRSNSANRKRNYSSDNNGLCFYHSKFGTRAYKCVQPCKWINYKSKSRSSSYNANRDVKSPGKVKKENNQGNGSSLV